MPAAELYTEITNKRLAIRESKGDWHVQTNQYLTEELAGAYLDLNPSVTEDSKARSIRAEQLIRKSWGRFNAREAVLALSDKYDPINQEIKGFGNIIASHMTLSSAVFDPARGRLFVASGMGPVSLTPYVELPLIQELDEKNFSTEPYEVLENSSFHHSFPQISQAEQKYIQAKVAFEIYNNPKKAILILKDAMKLDPENSTYSFIHGILSLKVKDLAEGAKSFQLTTTKKYRHYQLASQYYLGRIWASQGKALEAKKIWQGVLEEADPETEKALV